MRFVRIKTKEHTLLVQKRVWGKTGINPGTPRAVAPLCAPLYNGGRCQWNIRDNIVTKQQYAEQRNASFRTKVGRVSDSRPTRTLGRIEEYAYISLPVQLSSSDLSDFVRLVRLLSDMSDTVRLLSDLSEIPGPAQTSRTGHSDGCLVRLVRLTVETYKIKNPQNTGFPKILGPYGPKTSCFPRFEVLDLKASKRGISWSPTVFWDPVTTFFADRITKIWIMHSIQNVEISRKH